LSIEGDFQKLIESVQAGDPNAAGQILELCYSDLGRIASRLMAKERDSHTWDTCDLVQEFATRAIEGELLEKVNVANRGQFLALASTMMRHFLIDYARRHNIRPEAFQVPLDEFDGHVMRVPLTDVRDALERLSQIAPETWHVVELSYFFGMTLREIEDATGLTEHQVRTKLRLGRNWLAGAIGASRAGEGA
jgi:RNA polymerase sigma factor (TIGR02999 family)